MLADYANKHAGYLVLSERQERGNVLDTHIDPLGLHAREIMKNTLDWI
ncbi:MAG: hypothetical protein GXO43_03715 [Crenarchaeota archaeon]|nr:hypothetical protein [Thermoproteota archaeon]